MKEIASVLLDPTRKRGAVYEIRRTRKGYRYYRNGWRISEKEYDAAMKDITKRMNESSSTKEE